MFNTNGAELTPLSSSTFHGAAGDACRATGNNVCRRSNKSIIRNSIHLLKQKQKLCHPHQAPNITTDERNRVSDVRAAMHTKRLLLPLL